MELLNEGIKNDLDTGTTMTCCIINRKIGKFFTLNIGDSRIYGLDN